jgi:hypothetical protein
MKSYCGIICTKIRSIDNTVNHTISDGEKLQVSPMELFRDELAADDDAKAQR